MAELGSRTFALSRGFTCSKPVCGRKAETAISIRGKEDIDAFGIFILRYAQPIRPVGCWIIVSEQRERICNANLAIIVRMMFGVTFYAYLL